jgi:hypothetical protein
MMFRDYLAIPLAGVGDNSSPILVPYSVDLFQFMSAYPFGEHLFVLNVVVGCDFSHRSDK